MLSSFKSSSEPELTITFAATIAAAEVCKLRSGIFIGEFRRICVISAPLRETPAATKCQFKQYL